MTGFGFTPFRRDLRDGPTPIDPRQTAIPGAARYSHWDGSQSLPDLDADEILDALADDMMAEGDIEAALRRLMQRGWRSTDPTRSDMPVLRDLLDRIAARRQDLLERYRLGDVLGDVRRELDEIVAEERAGVERRLDTAAQQDPAKTEPGAASETGAGSDAGSPAADDPALRRMLRDMAAKRLDQLDALPPDVGGRIRGLEEYDFMEPGARQRFDELVERLRRQVLDQYVGGLSDAIKSTTPEDLAANREMVRDLNRLLQERLSGGDPDASEFLAKHGRFFPGAQTVDDIIEQLAERMAAMQSLLQSMTPEQRAELQDAMDALLRDDRLRWDLAQLAATMDQLLPGGLGERFRFGGDEPLGLEGALRQMADLQALESLADQLDGTAGPGDLADVDRDRVRDLLGDEAVRDLQALDELAERLERAGYLTRDGERLELTPRGSRRIGQKVLDDLFARLRRDAFGDHRSRHPGQGRERDETTKPYEFGDPFHLDLRRTLANALTRT
ncbi:MAG TPA: VWA domain-containing protein, partial [Candidatus Binatia bacterium]|nr:VWA domain-containing protein [Candidatus Binatia bacterium]